MLAAGAGAFLIAGSLRAATTPAAGAVAPVNPGAGDLLDIRAHNSPTVVANPLRPDNLVITNRVDTPAFACAIHVSFDGAARWSETAIPFPEGEDAPPRCFAPDAGFGPDGALYLSFATLAGGGNSPNAVWVSSSSDGGRTLSRPVRVAGEYAFQVRLAVDPITAGRVYLSWLQAMNGPGNLSLTNPGNPIVVSRSDDGGATWAPPVAASSPARQRVVAPSPVAMAGDGIHVLHVDVRDDSLDYHGAHQGRGGDPYPGTWSLVLARSSDGGRTWEETVVADRLVPIERFVVFFPPFPSIAADRNGRRVYAAFHDARLGDADAWVWASADGGATFAHPVRVNDTEEGDATSQYLPEVAVAPRGRVDVVYYDRRHDPANVLNGVSFQSSFDGATTFGGSVSLSDRPFDSRIGFGSERGLPDLGSRLGLASTDQSAVAVWTDTRAGTEGSNKQDLARAVVRFDESALRTPLRAAGVVGAVLGVLVLLWWALSRQAPLRER